MKNTIFKRRLFFGAILLFSCENDDVSQKEPSTQNQTDFVVKKLNFKELKNNTKAFEKLQEAEAKSTTHLGRGLFDENFGVFVDTTNIVMIQEGNNHSYTLRLVGDNSENEIKNLVLHASANLTYRAYIATYASTAEEVNNILTNEMLTEIAPTSIVELGLSSRNGIGGDGADCIDFFTITQMYCRNAAGNTIVDSGSDLGNDCVGMSWPEEFVVLRLDHDCMSDSGGNFGTTNPGGQYGPPLNPGNTGGGVGGSSPTSPDPLLTTPLLPFAIKDFVITLSPEKKLAYNSLSVETKQDFLNFFQLDRSYEAFEYAESLLDYLILNNYSPEAEEEICNILDLLDDGKINGEAVLVGPDVTITNMTQYLSIFNTSLPAEITISADQPLDGTDRLLGPDLVGHAFITIKQGTKTRSLGFYPQYTVGSLIPNSATLDPNDFISTPGAFGNDEGHDFDVSLTKSITASQLSNTINEIIAVYQSDPLYNLSTLNCTDFAISIFEGSTGIDIPSCESPGIFWDGQTPGTLGEVIKDIALPSGTIINTSGGNAPLNSTH